MTKRSQNPPLAKMMAWPVPFRYTPDPGDQMASRTTNERQGDGMPPDRAFVLLSVFWQDPYEGRKYWISGQCCPAPLFRVRPKIWACARARALGGQRRNPLCWITCDEPEAPDIWLSTCQFPRGSARFAWRRMRHSATWTSMARRTDDFPVNQWAWVFWFSTCTLLFATPNALDNNLNARST